MPFSRRRFLGLTAAGVLAGTSGPLTRLLSGRTAGDVGPSAARAAKPLRILILGGTGFIGPYEVRHAVERGHSVAVFNRGRRSAEGLPDGVEQLVGDRETGELDAIRGRDWDAVLDNSAYIPRWVDDAVQALDGRAGHYVFVSTVAVYRYPNTAPLVDEDAPLLQLADPTTERVTGETYGGLKVLAERAARRFDGPVTVLRPHYIVGPEDPTNRWTYWPVRVERGGEMLAQGAPGEPWQFIDVRDFADFAVHLMENRTAGTYNVARPPQPTSEILDTLKRVTGSSATFTWVPAEFLARHEVELPAWDPHLGATLGEMLTSAERSVAAGLTFRPLETTTRETLDWWHAQPAERRASPRAFLTPEREAEVLSAWKAERGEG